MSSFNTLSPLMLYSQKIKSSSGGYRKIKCSIFFLFILFCMFSIRPFFSFADKTSVHVSMCVSIHSASVAKLVFFNKNDIKCHNT